MKKQNNTGNAIIGAAFLMAMSAIGAGFLTQTSLFTGQYGASFGFAILISIILSAISQLNIWRVICCSGLRGQDVANRLLPGLGYFVSFMVILGGLVFAIANVGGGALGFEVLLNIPTKIGIAISGIVSIIIFLFKNAKEAADTLSKVLGAIMIIVIIVMIFIVKPPIGAAFKNTFCPESGITALFSPILTLLGGTVGGYITFAGAHRLIDAGITGETRLRDITTCSVMGIGIAAIVRVLLFLSVLGVIAKFPEINLAVSSNPASDAFLAGAGQLGYRFSGLVLLCAAITSIIGAAYTSASFLKTFHPKIERNDNYITIVFIAVATIVMLILGAAPAVMLVLAGAFNGLILPITLLICLIAARNKSIMGDKYHHPTILWWLGIIVVFISAYIGIKSFAVNIAMLF